MEAIGVPDRLPQLDGSRPATAVHPRQMIFPNLLFRRGKMAFWQVARRFMRHLTV